MSRQETQYPCHSEEAARQKHSSNHLPKMPPTSEWRQQLPIQGRANHNAFARFCRFNRYHSHQAALPSLANLSEMSFPFPVYDIM